MTYVAVILYDNYYKLEYNIILNSVWNNFSNVLDFE